MRRQIVYWFLIMLLWISFILLVFERSSDFERSLFNMRSAFRKIQGLTVSDYGGIKLNETWLQMCQGDVRTGSDSLLIPNCESTPVSGVIGLASYFIKINSDGFRGREYSVDKPSNTFRVIVLGDSFTFGQGFNLEDTFCYRLEKLLNENHPEKNFEVLNLFSTHF